MICLRTPAGLYLDPRGGLTRDPGSARTFPTKAAAMLVLRMVRRSKSLDLRLLVGPGGLPPRPQRPMPLTAAQRFALELVSQRGGLRRHGEAWVPLDGTAPRVAAITVRSLVRRGELAVTAEDGSRRYRHRWAEVRAREAVAA